MPAGLRDLFECGHAHPGDVQGGKARHQIVQIMLAAFGGNRGEYEIGDHSLGVDRFHSVRGFAQICAGLDGHAQVGELFFGSLIQLAVEFGSWQRRELIERGRPSISAAFRWRTGNGGHSLYG